MDADAGGASTASSRSMPEVGGAADPTGSAPNRSSPLRIDKEVNISPPSMKPAQENSESDSHKRLNVDDKVYDPKVGMIFNSCDDLMEYYTKYAKQSGFTVLKRTSSKGNDGNIRYMTVACSWSGKSSSTSKNLFKKCRTKKTNCKAKLWAIIDEAGKCLLSSIVLDHNHELAPGKAGFYKCNRVIRPYVKRKLETNDRAVIQSKKSFNPPVDEAGGHENLPVLDYRNYIEKGRRLRLGDGDADAMHNYFLKMQADNSNFFYTFDLDDKGRLRNLFWADARSRAAYEEFGDVITFDTTYLTNRYHMPFALFVGVNHHGQLTLLGCGLISGEDTETFTWLFQSWLVCMSGCPPNAIITDQDKAIKKSIQKVLPNARHRLCLWHLMKKLHNKLKGYNQYESIKYSLQAAVYDSLSCEEFEEKWNGMIEKFKLHSDELVCGLYNERHHWVPTYVKDSFWAGLSTTQRGESMHVFFDGHVNSKTTLKQFFEQYENVLRSKIEQENQEDHNSFNSCVPCITHYDMEKQFQDAYTTTKFKEFQKELTGKIYCDLSIVNEGGELLDYIVYEDLMVGENRRRAHFKVCFDVHNCDIKCNCRLFVFKGILCRHAISVFIHKEIYSVSARYILPRWKKELKRSHTNVKISYVNWSVKPESQRFDKMCNAFHEAADLAKDSEDKCDMVINWIHELKGELQKKNGVCGSKELLKSNAEKNCSNVPIGNPSERQDLHDLFQGNHSPPTHFYGPITQFQGGHRYQVWSGHIGDRTGSGSRGMRWGAFPVNANINLQGGSMAGDGRTGN